MTRNSRLRTVNVSYLLFTGNRDFLVKKDGQQVKAADLKRKTVVLIICPLYGEEDFKRRWEGDSRNPGSIRDLVEAYEELTSLGGVEFVFVPVYIADKYNSPSATQESKKVIYNKLLSTMPWPALPFDDVRKCGGRVAETFSIHISPLIPYWVIINPAGKVVATESTYPYLFKLFGGAELYPLSPGKLRRLWDEFDPWTKCNQLWHCYRCESRKRVINKWARHLASPSRDFLLSSNGEEVPISSLHDKVIGLYFCENIPGPPNMELIKKVYGKAKQLGYKFEIVQINFHYQFFNAIYTERADLDKEVVYEDINWLRLPFKDPSCRKLQRMFLCEFDDENYDWCGDCLVIIDPRDSTEVLFEFCGVEILREYGIKGYPFTRQSLLKTERIRQEEELTLVSVFGEGRRFMKNGCDWGDVSQLIRKKVLVLLGACESQCNCLWGGCESQCKYVLDASECGTLSGGSECKSRIFVSMLKSQYCEQVNDEAGENRFEVVYVSTDMDESPFNQCVQDMPWLVVPFSPEFGFSCQEKVFKYGLTDIGAAAFDIEGRLIAKERQLCFGWGKNESDKFPFVSQDWDGWIKDEVEAIFQSGKYSYHTKH